jgi:hypothetical protein
VDLAKGLEVAGSARLFSFDNLGWFGVRRCGGTDHHALIGSTAMRWSSTTASSPSACRAKASPTCGRRCTSSPTTATPPPCAARSSSSPSAGSTGATATLPETGLVTIDTETDSVESFEVDERCAGITESVTLDSGDVYFVSSALAAAANRLGRLDVEPCALRVKRGETKFDAD